ncbi:hypothetical protein TVAG_045910 [Trichomonas vaginalis G3]|uniref:Uncharacterized protein n=1 Tax=Trichomonas vaginalis (strain ATCC PRA-98 / G3) TaxID=412133 RepID=A2DMG2_TRIV3|nr:armadillo (ARM) repeat-containing protein family [Trichomonas vaginalis G3]EAY18389.1 hypothetical protein TVAG_045910 [Trichomonas vaginalis G3]KAI5530341.1 armadillo (ARM) repeat-containing protein family [Trichomonas vaginalis G3]|eukprot:XP_001579375.1 hypothetical protein [Trichomonas vaginalis G3]
MDEEYKDQISKDQFSSHNQENIVSDQPNNVDFESLHYSISAVVNNLDLPSNLEVIKANIKISTKFIANFNNQDVFNSFIEILQTNKAECGLIMISIIGRLWKLEESLDSAFNDLQIPEIMISLFKENPIPNIQYKITKALTNFAAISQNNIEILISLDFLSLLNMFIVESDGYETRDVTCAFKFLQNFCKFGITDYSYELMQFLPHLSHYIVSSEKKLRELAFQLLHLFLSNEILFERSCLINIQSQLVESARLDLIQNDLILFSCVYKFIENGFTNCFASDDFITSINWHLENSVRYNIKTSILIVYYMTDKHFELIEKHHVYESLFLFVDSSIFDNKYWSIKTICRYLSKSSYDYQVQYIDKLLDSIPDFVESLDEKTIIDLLSILINLLTNNNEVYKPIMIDLDLPDIFDSDIDTKLDETDDLISQFLKFFEEPEN